MASSVSDKVASTSSESEMEAVCTTWLVTTAAVRSLVVSPAVVSGWSVRVIVALTPPPPIRTGGCA